MQETFSLNSLKKNKPFEGAKRRREGMKGKLFSVWSQIGSVRVSESLAQHERRARRILSFLPAPNIIGPTPRPDRMWNAANNYKRLR